MRKIVDIDILSDEGIQKRIYFTSLVIVVVGAVVCVTMFALGIVPGATEVLDVWWVLALSVCSILPLAIHELVHAAFFKLLSPSCHVSFGFAGAFIFTKTDGVVLPRAQMSVVLLAPSVVVTLGLAAICLCAGCPLLAAVASFTHLSGCSGDFLVCAYSLLCPECTHVKDTDNGVTLLAQEEDA